jgi:hypothetical protein
VKIDPSAAVAVDVRTPRIALAARLFAAFRGTTLGHGFVEAPNDIALDRRLPFLRAIDGAVHAPLELEPAKAATLTRAFADQELQWQADDTLVTLPAGAISTHLVLPFSDEDEMPWREDIARALRKARASSSTSRS